MRKNHLRKWLMPVLMVVFGIMFTFSASALDSGKVYKFISKQSGMALDVSESSVSEGAYVVQSTISDADSQKWLIQSVGDGFFSAIAQHSGKALELAAPYPNDGIPAQQWTYLSNEDQKWIFEDLGDGYYSIISPLTGKCLGVQGDAASDGALIQQGVWANLDSQKWDVKFAADPPKRSYSFEADDEGWFSKNTPSTPYASTTWSSDGSYSLQLDVDQGASNTFFLSKAQDLDLSSALEISATVRQSTPPVPGEELQVLIYVLTGEYWAWYSTPVTLCDDDPAGTTLTFDLSGVSDLGFTRELGLHFIAGNNASGMISVFVDNVKVTLDDSGRPGEVVNTYNGDLYEDNAGNKYILEKNYPDPYVLNKVNPVDGSFLWSYNFSDTSGGVYFSRENELYLTSSDAFMQMDIDTGVVENSLPVFLAPVEETDTYFIFADNSSKVITVVDKTTLQVVWDAAFASNYSMSRMLEAGTLYVILQDRYASPDSNKIAAYDLATGALKWTYEVIADSFYIDSKNTVESGYMYIKSKDSYSKISKADGTTVWSYAHGFTSYYNAARVEDAIYLFRQGKLIKVDPSTGLDLWIYNGITGMNYIFSGNKITGTKRDYSAKTTTVASIDAASGTDAWSKQYAGYSVSFEYVNGSLFVINGNDIALLGDIDGEPQWSYTIPARVRIYTDSAKTALVLNFGDTVKSIDTVTGGILWTYTPSAGNAVQVTASDDRLYVRANDYTLGNYSFSVLEMDGTIVASNSGSGALRGYKFIAFDSLYLFTETDVIFMQGGSIVWQTNISPAYSNIAVLTVNDSENAYFYDNGYTGGYGNPYEHSGFIISINKTSGVINWKTSASSVTVSHFVTDTLCFFSSNHYSGAMTIYSIVK